MSDGKPRPTVRDASYAVIPIGFAGVVMGIFDVTQGNLAGIVVALVGASAAVLAVVKLRTRRQND